MRKSSMFRHVSLASLIMAIAAVQASGQMWIKRTPGVSPPVRYHHSMVYDTARSRVVLFGGFGILNGGPKLFNDTWEWDGNTWIQHSPPLSPPGQAGGHAMAYDAARKLVVLFGGNGTWVWDGTLWKQVACGANIPGRFGHAMAYDPARKRVVLSAGQPHPFAIFNDTWEWDGNRWSQMNPAVNPGCLTFHDLAYDATRKRIVMFSQNSFWDWDGNNWTHTMLAGSSPNQFRHAMACDTTRQCIVLFGGSHPGNNTTWEWNGSTLTWKQTTPAVSPPVRCDHTMVHDAARNRMVLFGGIGNGIGSYLNDTWEYAGQPFLLASGATRPGGTVSLTLMAPGNEWQPYHIGSSLGTGPISVGTRRINLSIDNLMVVSTSNLWPWIFSGYQGIIDGKGQATASINIPNIPGLIGSRIHTAFVTLDPAAPSGIRSISKTKAFQITK